MVFIKNPVVKVGGRVVLTRDVTIFAGTFKSGTEMTITRDSYRGLDFIDDEGNQLCETGLMGNSFYRIIG